MFPYKTSFSISTTRNPVGDFAREMTDDPFHERNIAVVAHHSGCHGEQLGKWRRWATRGGKRGFNNFAPRIGDVGKGRCTRETADWDRNDGRMPAMLIWGFGSKPSKYHNLTKYSIIIMSQALLMYLSVVYQYSVVLLHERAPCKRHIYRITACCLGVGGYRGCAGSGDCAFRHKSVVCSIRRFRTNILFVELYGINFDINIILYKYKYSVELELEL